MKTFPDGTATVLARCVSAEVRARQAARRLTQRDLARAGEFSSLTYLSQRLTDKLPFDVDDVDRLAKAFETSPSELIATAVANHHDRIEAELSEASVRPGFPVAAHDEVVSIEEEIEAHNEP